MAAEFWLYVSKSVSLRRFYVSKSVKIYHQHAVIRGVFKMNCNKDRKLSIRFYKDREVRAVWDGELNKWWFSVLDIIGVLNEQVDE